MKAYHIYEVISFLNKYYSLWPISMLLVRYGLIKMSRDMFK